VRNRTTILILGAAQFVMVLDTTVMNVSISQVVDDLDTTVPGVQLAITMYTLVMAAFMLTGAKLGDIWGRRRAFSIGCAVYGVGSLTTALSPNLGVLLFGWSLVEGLGAVLVIPAIASLAAVNYSGRERAMAFGLLGGIAGAGAAVGPLIGGFVTSALTWRVVFASETLVVLGILLVVKRIHDEPIEGGKPKLDVVGSVLSALGLGLVVFGILKISTWGLFKPSGALTIGGTEITPFGLSVVPFLIMAGFAVLDGFFHWEARLQRAGRVPLLRPDLLRIPQMRAGLSTVVSQFLILAGTFFVIPLYLQLVLGKDALQTGLKILPISVTMMIAALLGPRLAARMSPRRVCQIGLGILFVAIIVLMASIAPELNSPWFFVSLALFGTGIGLVISQLGFVVMSSVPASRSSEAGGLQGAAQNLGQSLGTALIGAMLLTGLTTSFIDRVNADQSLPSSLKQQLAGASEQGVQMVSQADAKKAAEKAGLRPAQVDTLVGHYGEAQVDALKRALLLASLFTFVGLWFARGLPGASLAQESEARAPPQTSSIPATAAT
jgi:MFS family permease